MPSRTYDVAIIGGGVVGLAIARRLLGEVDSLILFEKESNWAYHTSGRNSGVIHSGVYYKPGSLPAELCARANRRLYDYCAATGVPARQVGKLIVACTDDEMARIQERKEWAEKNGVPGVKYLEGPAAIRKTEPNVSAVAALRVPSAGIIDSRALARSYAGEVFHEGRRFDTPEARRTRATPITSKSVTAMEQTDDGFLLRARGRYTRRDDIFRARCLVNAAGLHADRLAHQMGVGLDYAIVPFRGDYLEVAPRKRGLVRGLIYPPPDPEVPFLGVHFTRHLDDAGSIGPLSIGPNAMLALGRENYHMFPQLDSDPRVWPENMLDWCREVRDLPRQLVEPAFWSSLVCNSKVRRIAPDEMLTSLSVAHAYEKAKRMVPALKRSDVMRAPHRSGIRAQLVRRRTGELVNELKVETTDDGQVHILGPISPAMTMSIELADHIFENYLKEHVGR